MREGERADPGGQEHATGGHEAVRGLRGGRPPGKGRDDRRAGGRPGRPPRRDEGREHGEQHRGDDRPPREVEAVDAMVREMFEHRSERDPSGEADQRAADRADGTDNRAVGEHREAHVAVGRAERAEHAERAQAPLRHDREPCRRDQADEQQPDGLERQDGRRDGGLARRRAQADLGVAAGVERLELVGRAVEQHRDPRRRVGLPRRDEGELVAEVDRVLDDPDHLARRAVLGELVADVQPEGRGGTVGERDLVRAGRVATGHQAQQDVAVLAEGVLRPQVERGGRAGDGDALVVDLLDHTEAFACRRDGCGVGAGDGHLPIGRPEGGVEGPGRVRRERDADHRGRHREDDEGEHQ